MRNAHATAKKSYGLAPLFVDCLHFNFEGDSRAEMIAALLDVKSQNAEFDWASSRIAGLKHAALQVFKKVSREKSIYKERSEACHPDYWR